MRPVRRPRVARRVLLVGLGGLGCPAALALARAGVGTLGLCDDDDVERSNLHRQILFGDADVGAPKLDAAARALGAVAHAGAAPPELRLHRTRLLPDNALSLVREYDVVLEGTDNFATKFLAADACALAGVPVVHASAVRWVGTALAVGAGGGPCYRCLFEDVLPADDAPELRRSGRHGAGGRRRRRRAGRPRAGPARRLAGRGPARHLRRPDRRAPPSHASRAAPTARSAAGGRTRRASNASNPSRYVSPACAG